MSQLWFGVRELRGIIPRIRETSMREWPGHDEKRNSIPEPEEHLSLLFSAARGTELFPLFRNANSMAVFELSSLQKSTSFKSIRQMQIPLPGACPLIRLLADSWES